MKPSKKTAFFGFKFDKDEGNKEVSTGPGNLMNNTRVH